jgi:SAM-dependent methyltransferase
MSEAFFTLHRDLPREGPGTPEDVLWALSHVGWPELVIDAGCGPGADTVTLAEALPHATITAVDKAPHFVAEAARRLAPFGARAKAIEGDLATLQGPVDFIWSAGAVYLRGLEVVLPEWRKVLRPGGKVAFSEAVFVSEQPPDAVRAFWGDFTPSTVEGLMERVRAQGWDIHGVRRIQGKAWSDYYDPMEARIAKLRSQGVTPEVEAVLQDAEREIAGWRAAPDEIAYLLLVIEP